LGRYRSKLNLSDNVWSKLSVLNLNEIRSVISEMKHAAGGLIWSPLHPFSFSVQRIVNTILFKPNKKFNAIQRRQIHLWHYMFSLQFLAFKFNFRCSAFWNKYASPFQVLRLYEVHRIEVEFLFTQISDTFRTGNEIKPNDLAPGNTSFKYRDCYRELHPDLCIFRRLYLEQHKIVSWNRRHTAPVTVVVWVYPVLNNFVTNCAPRLFSAQPLIA
jgi:hypothetical protein